MAAVTTSPAGMRIQAPAAGPGDIGADFLSSRRGSRQLRNRILAATVDDLRADGRTVPKSPAGGLTWWRAFVAAARFPGRDAEGRSFGADSALLRSPAARAGSSGRSSGSAGTRLTRAGLGRLLGLRVRAGRLLIRWEASSDVRHWPVARSNCQPCIVQVRIEPVVWPKRLRSPLICGQRRWVIQSPS